MSAANVVATMLVPASHHGMDRPPAKNWSVPREARRANTDASPTVDARTTATMVQSRPVIGGLGTAGAAGGYRHPAPPRQPPRPPLCDPSRPRGSGARPPQTNAPPHGAGRRVGRNEADALDLEDEQNAQADQRGGRRHRRDQTVHGSGGLGEGVPRYRSRREKLIHTREHDLHSHTPFCNGLGNPLCPFCSLGRFCLRFRRPPRTRHPWGGALMAVSFVSSHFLSDRELRGRLSDHSIQRAGCRSGTSAATASERHVSLISMNDGSPLSWAGRGARTPDGGADRTVGGAVDYRRSGRSRRLATPPLLPPCLSTSPVFGPSSSTSTGRSPDTDDHLVAEIAGALDALPFLSGRRAAQLARRIVMGAESPVNAAYGAIDRYRARRRALGAQGPPQAVDRPAEPVAGAPRGGGRRGAPRPRPRRGRDAPRPRRALPGQRRLDGRGGPDPGVPGPPRRRRPVHDGRRGANDAAHEAVPGPARLRGRGHGRGAPRRAS